MLHKSLVQYLSSHQATGLEYGPRSFNAKVKYKNFKSVTLILKSRIKMGMKLHKISPYIFHHIVNEQIPANKLEIMRTKIL